ncbi:TPR repeat-containing thioredoxin TTL1-like [Gossypium australe]|uniref:TPR repeat-containing thioredoxin TTL1-like n=1 Tax=Gossypium australe TaxID=47621 RepID=A0A5B6W6F5_9ROSI|nr:TPR repeat-containing thioredoxin TTL1-like [Gossypium australe]
MTKCSMEQELGCGLMGGVFQRWSNWSKKSSVPALPGKGMNKVSKEPVTDKSKKLSNNDDSRWRRCTSTVEPVLLDSSNLAKPLPEQDQKPVRKSELLPPRNSVSYSHPVKDSRRLSNTGRSSTSSSSGSTHHSKELAKVTTSDQQQSNNSKALIRATSSNIMLAGQLGNLRQLGAGSAVGNNGSNATIEALDKLPRKNSLGKLGGSLMGNIIRQPSDEFKQLHGLTGRLDPETLKNKGNEAYKQGRFEEALALYERAISLDSKQATYRCNKSAALLGLGRLMEAIVECKEAIQLDPTYCRAHHRLATIYFRLGEPEHALYHYKHAGNHADSNHISEAQTLIQRLKRCSDARKLHEWNTLLKETQCVITSGVDSAPEVCAFYNLYASSSIVYALQTEALLKINQHQEACITYNKGPKFAIESCINFFGLTVSAYLLMIKALVNMVSGRLDEAVSAAQHAARLDPGNKEISLVVKRTRAVSSARLSGNLLFKASKFVEACIVYGEGLEYDSYNPVLLCNRAACRSKLGQFEKAIEDCTAALNVQPSYSKARLRRADCNSKLERWETAIQDYEMLIRETPGDEEVARALFEAKVQLKKQHGEDIEDLKFGSNLVLVSSNERFRHFVTSPGMTVVLFCNKTKHKQVVQIMEQVCKRFPSINFLKVEIEDHPYLAKSEALTCIPAFKIYKNGSRVKEVPGNDAELLERSVKLYSS